MGTRLATARKRSQPVLGLLLLVSGLAAQDAIPSADPLTKLGLACYRLEPIVGTTPADVGATSFSFLVGGHLYGHKDVADQGLCPTLGRKLDELAIGGDRFMVSLGDFMFRFSAADLRRAREGFSRLGRPVFNAPGNHDWRPVVYRRTLAADFGCFVQGTSLFVVLNTEIDPWFIQGIQLDMLRRALAAAAGTKEVERVFVFSHKLVWTVGDPRYAPVLAHVNARDGFFGVSNFAADVAPILRVLAVSKEVIWFSGDIGMPWSFTLFRDRHPVQGVTYVATGLGNRNEDVLLRVRVQQTGPARRVAP